MNLMHSCLHVHAQTNDPTRTLTLRKQFESEMKRRFKRIIKAVRKQVIENNVLGLTETKPTSNKFDLSDLTTTDKVNGFLIWLNEQIEKEVLEASFGTPVLTAASDSWMNLYIKKAYNNGMKQGASNMRSSGAEVSSRFVQDHRNRQIHADRLGLIFIRTYDNLTGITKEMGNQISEIMAEGMIHGSSKRLAKDINDRIAKIGITRARTIARTELNRAHNAAKLNLFSEAGLSYVDVEAEVLTAGDDRVSDICKSLAAGGPYTIAEAKNLLPAHPNCRSTWNPRIKNGTGIKLL